MGNHLIDITNQKFGMLFAKSPTKTESGSAVWLCVCDCGNEVLRTASYLRTKKKLSCGCKRIKKKEVWKTSKTHGMIKTSEYKIWLGMRNRCLNPNNQAYCYYGAVGITVCERWNKFENFHEDMGPRPSSKYSLERINNKGNYEPSNCKWATDEEQNSNRSTSRLLTFNDKTQSLSFWAREVGLTKECLQSRISRGWSIEKALTTSKKTFEKRSKEYNAWTGMKRRCNNKNNKYYGGKGIKVCERWNKFENFYKDVGMAPGEEYYLDRINNNGDYEPKNCRWAKKVYSKNN